MCSRVHVWALLSSLPQIKLSQDLAFQPRTLPLFLLENTNSLKRPFTLQWVRRQGETMLAAENTTVFDLARALGTTPLLSLHHSAQAQISIHNQHFQLCHALLSIRVTWINFDFSVFQLIACPSKTLRISKTLGESAASLEPVGTSWVIREIYK